MSGECEIGARPQRWTQIVEKSRWPEEPFAITVTVLDGSFEEAAAKLKAASIDFPLVPELEHLPLQIGK